jgi:hypothetical protein
VGARQSRYGEGEPLAWLSSCRLATSHRGSGGGNRSGARAISVVRLGRSVGAAR